MAYFNKCGSELLNMLRHSAGTKDRKSMNQYRAIVRQFADFIREKYGTERVDPRKYKELIQEYLDFRRAVYSPHTVHHDCAALARAIGCDMREFRKPRRTPSTKGRGSEGTWTEAGAKVVEAAPQIGIRKAEYKRLTGGDIKTEGDYTYVYVTKGKGGKRQWQQLHPDEADSVQALFESVEKEERVFSESEIAGAERANLQLERRNNALKMYEYYISLSEEEKVPLREEMRRRFEERNKHKAYKAYLARLKKTPIYVLRGIRRQRAIETGVPYKFNREAVMLVSVFCLSHFREDVTVEYYLYEGF